MIVILLVILIPILYCFTTMIICSVNGLYRENGRFIFPIKSFMYESLLQYFVFIFLPIDLIRKWEINKTKSNKYVILLPGYSETQFIFWRIRKVLKLTGVNFFTIKYKPFLGDLHLQIEILKTQISSISATEDDAEIYLIGHSMGGLIGRYYVENYDNNNIKLLVMIATPHRGTILGKFGIGRSAKQLIPENPFLKKLKNNNLGKILNIYSKADSLICPRQSAIYSDNSISLDSKPLHNSTLFNRQTLTLIKDKILNEKH